ncbi:bifunctional UDP-N-acetylglucosamine diphosphorylase/glucosamine-1-phosphate N-acetyltransferase GlmU [Galenea microaerophila]
MSLVVTILAAGKGTRMKSKLPKVLQPLAKKPLLKHVIETAQQLNAHKILPVIGHGAELVQQSLQDDSLHWVMQTEQLGTGHAVQQVVPYLEADDQVLILYGDVPLIQPETLQDLLSLLDEQHPLALLTVSLDQPKGYGRILRDAHMNVTAIVEEKDASLEQKQVQEVNTGIMAVNATALKKWLAALNNKNAQGEYYLTDIIAMAVADGYHIRTTQPQDEREVLGVNDKLQLQKLERIYQSLQAEKLMQAGVTLLDANRLDIRGNVQVGQDVEIEVNVVLEGEIQLGDNVKIGANCILRNCQIEANTVIEPFSHLEEAKVGRNCTIGPYARLRPGTVLSDNVKIGNFVETKKAHIGSGSKVNHLSYIGDTQMGGGCNIGAGTITCNYDGVNKHQTLIGEGVFVGSDTQLIAPVEVGDHATIGAGSTIAKDVPPHQLTLSRSKQVTITGWQKPSKKESK